LQLVQPTALNYLQRQSSAGREFFRELDRDGDGKVKTEDVRAALRARNLPERLAGDFIKSARGGRWWDNTVE
jgi:Ca2+-binding EF-hand superfamily protein